MFKNFIFIFCFSFFFPLSYSQTRTVGLLKYPAEHQQTYYLYTPLNSKKTFLVDDCGQMINSWTSNYTAGATQVLLDDGSILRCGLVLPTRFGLGSGGIIEKFDWNGNLTWKFKLSDTLQCLHHDIKAMPNGNILAIVWEYISPTDAMAKGRKSSIAYPNVWGERVIEIKPIGTDSFDIVWEWATFDHVIQNHDNSKQNYGVPSDHPELFNINFVGNNPQDWFHFNSVDYNAELDQIVLCAHSTDEFYIIDHSTNSVQAAGHSGGKYGMGGDVLYRWGNPMAYDRGDSTNRLLFKPHHAHWIPQGFKDAGKILIFNNGTTRTGSKYSTIDAIQTPGTTPGVYPIQNGKAFGPILQQIVYESQPRTDFYAMNLSGAYSIDSGYMITSGPQGLFFEIDFNSNVLWTYRNPVNGVGSINQGTNPTGNMVFRCIPYKPNFAGFSGRNMSSKGPLEINPVSPSLCETANNEIPVSNQQKTIYPNPVSTLLHLNHNDIAKITITNHLGQTINSLVINNIIDVSELKSGLYLLKIETTKGETHSEKFWKE